MKQKKRIIFAVILMAFLSFSCLTVSISYAFLSKIVVTNNTQVISTGNLNATINYTPSNSSILGTMTDNEGLNQTEMANITVSKNNVYSVFYSINLSYSVDSIPATKTTADLVPLEFVRVALYDGDTLITGPVAITDLPLNTVNENNVFNDTYLLSYGIFNAGSASKNYHLKAWLDPIISADYDSSIIYLELHIDQETLVSKSIYNVSGVVTSSGTPVSGAVVSLQNGASTATTSASGAYTLSNVPTGTYTLTVTSGNSKYETTINIRNGATQSLSTIGPSTGNASTYLQNSAYTYFCTPGRILRNNSLNTTTNEVSSSTYAIPSSYVLTGLESLSVLSIQNLNMSISGTDTLTLSLS